MAEEKKEDIFDLLQGRLSFHLEWAVSHRFWWDLLARSLQFSLPIISGVLTIIAADKSGLSHPTGQAAVFWIGGLLTLLTGLNSTLQPSKKVVFYSQYSNKFKALQADLEIERRELVGIYGEGTKEFLLKSTEVLKRRNREIANLIDGYNTEQDLADDPKANHPATSASA